MIALNVMEITIGIQLLLMEYVNVKMVIIFTIQSVYFVKYLVAVYVNNKLHVNNVMKQKDLNLNLMEMIATAFLRHIEHLIKNPVNTVASQ